MLAAGMLSLLLSWASVKAGVAEAVPVYRFWSPVLGSHFYTLEEAEKARLLSQDPPAWTYEGIAFRALPSGTADGSRPVYRFWSAQLHSYFYTVTVRRRTSSLFLGRGIMLPCD
jgi:hypothetical protein